jgi:hypothetical protein
MPVLALSACGGGGDGGGVKGGGGGVTDKPTSAEVQQVARDQGNNLPCEVTFKDGPALPDRVEHKLIQCSQAGGGITVGSYYRFKDAASLDKSKQSFGSGPRFVNGNVAVVIANVNEGPKALPAAIKQKCGCGEVIAGG